MVSFIVSYTKLNSAGSITINTYGTTTYCPVTTPIVVGDGTVTMMATGTDANDVITEENIPVVPVGTGVLIHGNANQAYNCYTHADLSTPPTETLDRNYLVGVTSNQEAPVNSYVLQYHSDEGFGFYQVASVTPTVGQGKAYLQLPGSNHAKVIYFTQEEAADHAATSIDVPTASQQVEAIYNLSGTRLTAPQRGISIIRRTDGTIIKKVLP